MKRGVNAGLCLLLLASGLNASVQGARADALDRTAGRLAQRLNPPPVPGGLPGLAPTLPAPQPLPNLPPAAPQLVPPAAPPAPQAPEAGASEACDCKVAVEVPVYENGRFMRWQPEERVVGRQPQCCRK
jgi:hypothetical protein